ncbi:RNA polymerase sigma factor SigJ [Povalibacter sp.]|uniref:RNA polymerase sigma factor SigJ n=1 Tax=Povalibacter sp. TaxID=1962978 RepID=UPI002F426BE2
MSSKADIFTQHRPRLWGVAYRMLGAKADAEDVLQDAYLRWHSTDSAQVESPEAWLMTATTRLSIDRLRHRKIEREAYFGPWLPEPLSAADTQTPEVAAELDSDVSIAFMAMLEALSPEERAAFILHDIIDDDYADIADALGKSEAACRQMVHRARERVTSRRRRFVVDDATRTRMLQKFICAMATGDRQQIKAVFDENSVHVSDGGGKATAAHRPLHGAERISMLWYAVTRRLSGDFRYSIVRVNGEPGLALFIRGRLFAVTAVETDGEKIHGYYSITNPEKLQGFLAG